jgi:hypothetical protein
MPCRQANDAEIGLFADLIGIDSAFWEHLKNPLKSIQIQD